MYEKQNFVDGQKLRAYQLNHMEEGIAEASNGFVALEQTATSEADGGENIITATRADGSTNTIVIRNGRTGATGPTGPKGDKGDPGSGASSWNDLTDKPFGEAATGGDTLTWDGNIEGLIKAPFSEEFGCYKVSDTVLSVDDLTSGGKVVFDTSASGEGVVEIPFSFEDAAVENDFIFIVGMVVVVTNSGGTTIDGVKFPESGIYFVCEFGDYVSTLTIPGYTGFPVVKTIDPKFLPEGYPYKETATIKGEQIDSFTVETVAKNNYGDAITYLAESGHHDSGAIPEGNVIINYDDVDYKTSRIVNNFGGMIYAHGNLSLYFPSLQDTGEPFCWFYFGGSCKLATATPGVHTVVVRAEDEQGTIVHPLAAEFLPKMVVEFTTQDGQNYTANKTFAEVEAAYKAGCEISGKALGNNGLAFLMNVVSALPGENGRFEFTTFIPFIAGSAIQVLILTIKADNTITGEVATINVSV